MPPCFPQKKSIEISNIPKKHQLSPMLPVLYSSLRKRKCKTRPRGQRTFVAVHLAISLFDRGLLEHKDLLLELTKRVEPSIYQAHAVILSAIAVGQPRLAENGTSRLSWSRRIRPVTTVKAPRSVRWFQCRESSSTGPSKDEGARVAGLRRQLEQALPSLHQFC